MPWTVLFHPVFADEFARLATSVQDELSAHLIYLQEAGPTLRRPHADTLNGSKHGNMKELRFSADDGAWRSLSIRNGGRSCWWPVTRPASARVGSTDR